MSAMLILLLLSASLSVETQTGAQIDPARLPLAASNPGDFVPRGWMIEAEAGGDLNNDSIPDLAVTLVEQLPPASVQQLPPGAKDSVTGPPERQRALLILFKTQDGRFSRAALANKVLLCTRCGGAFFGVVETPTNVEITNGVIIINQEYGSRELSKETFRFRYEPETRRFAFIGVDVKSHDRLTGENVTHSINLLTGFKLTTKTRIDNQTGDEKRTLNKGQRIQRSKKYIEDVIAGYGTQEEK